MSRRILWHIGPDDTGTAFLADALDGARETLEERGVLVPGAPESWRRATAEVTRTHADLGLAAHDVAGRAQDLTRRIWRHRGTTLLSTPSLARADATAAALALDGLQRSEIHLVLVVRDLRSQVGAAAREALLGGATTRPRTYADRVLGGTDHAQATAFAHGHDLPDLVERWRGAVRPRAVHVIAATDPSEIWARLMDLAGVADPPPILDAPRDLDAPGLDLLRDIALSLEDLDPAQRRAALTAVTPPPGGGDPLIIDEKAGRALVERWSAYAESAGVPVHGRLRVRTDTRTPTTHDEDRSIAQTLADSAARIVRLEEEVARLRTDNERLDRKRRKHKRRVAELRRNGAA
ncbi:hypothetical protein GCM10027425_04970 [Alteromonas gracilis]